jgi:hypothetical protein
MSLMPSRAILHAAVRGRNGSPIYSRISSGASSGVVNHVPPYECVTLSESYADEVMDKAKRNAEEN